MHFVFDSWVSSSHHQGHCCPMSISHISFFCQVTNHQPLNHNAGNCCTNTNEQHGNQTHISWQQFRLPMQSGEQLHQLIYMLAHGYACTMIVCLWSVSATLTGRSMAALRRGGHRQTQRCADHYGDSFVIWGYKFPQNIWEPIHAGRKKPKGHIVTSAHSRILISGGILCQQDKAALRSVLHTVA